MKECSKCHQTKPVEDFVKHAQCIGGRSHECKECSNAYKRERFKARPDLRERKLAAGRDYRRAYPEKAKESIRKSRLKDPEKTRALDAKRKERYRLSHPTAGRDYMRRRRKEDPQTVNAATTRWVKRNPDKVRESARKAYRRRWLSDPTYRLSVSIRNRLLLAIKRCGAVKSNSTLILTGCSWSFLRAHLESLFKPGMTWENHGAVWHIDHVKPLAKFNLADPEQQQVCCHWTNLQPLFVLENLKKGAK